MIEAERTAIAAEIHDGLLPYLYAAAAKLAAIRRSTHANSAESSLDERLDKKLDARLADAADWIDRSREVARTLMNGITYPPQALADPLAAAQAFLTQFSDLSDEGVSLVDMPAADLAGSGCSPKVHWQWGDGPSPLADRLPPVTAIAVYRLTTEFVRNALRHAGASRIEISAAYSDGVATVQIHDDGCGFDPREGEFSSPRGLALARHRAEAGGVELQLESQLASDHAAPTGTRVTLRAHSSKGRQPHQQNQPRSGHTDE